MNNELIHIIWKFAEKIQPVYALLDWTWCSDTPPTVKEIAESLEEYVLYLKAHKETSWIGSGGLFAEREPDAPHVISVGFEMSEYLFTAAELS